MTEFVKTIIVTDAVLDKKSEKKLQRIQQLAQEIGACVNQKLVKAKDGKLYEAAKK
ncbi:MAG: hypothetical protein V1857_06875 [archaeon]